MTGRWLEKDMDGRIQIKLEIIWWGWDLHIVKEYAKQTSGCEWYSLGSRKSLQAHGERVRSAEELLS